MGSEQDVPNRNESQAGGIRKDGSPYRVLVVDDSVFVTKQITQILTSEGFEIAGTAANGREGVERYKELYPGVDVVTIDITTPQRDGITALQEIIEFDKDACVVMISASGKQDLVKKSLQLGARNYIVKPLDRKKVLERILMSLRRQ